MYASDFAKCLCHFISLIAKKKKILRGGQYYYISFFVKEIEIHTSGLNQEKELISRLAKIQVRFQILKGLPRLILLRKAIGNK